MTIRVLCLERSAFVLGRFLPLAALAQKWCLPEQHCCPLTSRSMHGSKQLAALMAMTVWDNFGVIFEMLHPCFWKPQHKPLGNYLLSAAGNGAQQLLSANTWGEKQQDGGEWREVCRRQQGTLRGWHCWVSEARRAPGLSAFDAAGCSPSVLSRCHAGPLQVRSVFSVSLEAKQNPFAV